MVSADMGVDDDIMVPSLIYSFQMNDIKTTLRFFVQPLMQNNLPPLLPLVHSSRRCTMFSQTFLADPCPDRIVPADCWKSLY
jgi:hypothetical protein